MMDGLVRMHRRLSQTTTGDCCAVGRRGEESRGEERRGEESTKEEESRQQREQIVKNKKSEKSRKETALPPSFNLSMYVNENDDGKVTRPRINL
jgi:pSer/pThr/pTyr-binding forkhead associated (FHA) protein